MSTETAWTMYRRLAGHELKEALYDWFSTAQRTISFEGAGTRLLHTLPEDRALEVLKHAEGMMLGGKGVCNWRRFVATRDWPQHEPFHHPNADIVACYRSCPELLEDDMKLIQKLKKP